ncbi:hypothetical protein JAAARDRAFT_197152 [Jaapia argillacea MUCL 33604]|uniref:Uncharacterized protein n=1 Tax=Jaapia argillacea MUCL 33604 TaxID=933084 RepID=A0A067PFX7_9AGAM|nr:hypothetical protein JAAARDRAFT_197152 [Jaapia argillacea MUCL 33604]
MTSNKPMPHTPLGLSAHTLSLQPSLLTGTTLAWAREGIGSVGGPKSEVSAIWVLPTPAPTHPNHSPPLKTVREPHHHLPLQTKPLNPSNANPSPPPLLTPTQAASVAA